METVCKIIASLPQNASKNVVQSSLHEIIEKESISTLKVNYGGSKRSSDSDSTESVRKLTPLMVACDKSQVECLKYFYDIIILKTNQNQEVKVQQIIGHPRDVSPDSNNQAIHYAAMSCCAEAGVILAKLELQSRNHNQNSTCSKYGEKKDDTSLFHNFVKILCQQNSHGDTAFMMASFQGKSSLLGEWIQTLMSLAQQEGLLVKECLISLRQMTSMTNKSGDTCLSIAVGHAHVDVVHCLIQEREFWVDDSVTSYASSIREGIVLVNQTDVKKAQRLIEKIQSLSSLLLTEDNAPSEKVSLSDQKRQLMKQKIQNTRRCLVMLQVSIAKLAEKRSSELLESTTVLEVKGSIKKQKKPLRRVSNVQEKNDANNYKDGDIVEVGHRGRHLFGDSPTSSEVLSKPAFKTLNDGTIVSLDHQSESNQTYMGNNLIIAKDEKSIETLMKDRCLQLTTKVQNVSTSSVSSEAILESLCLDASMLLFSSQRMAMELSPSQLDVVETVLYQQLDAVVEARQIHERLMTNMKARSDKKG